MAGDILAEIVEKRKKDIETHGITFGFPVPKTRTRKIHQFVPAGKKCTILEIKRASPSKGDIAPNLNAGKTAQEYALSGAGAISCLTETNYFKGNLGDFMQAANALDALESEGKSVPALLRKDFLLNADEVTVSFRSGADAVLLIARILDKETLLAMAQKCAELKISALIEVRKDEDLQKLAFVAKQVPSDYIVCGVNARDLRDFSIDLLSPAKLLGKIKSILGEHARVVFESGIRTPNAAHFAGSLAFSALLLGEAAAKNPAEASNLVSAFCDAQSTKNAEKWLSLSQKMAEKSEHRPLVKICGITNEADALKAAQLGADFLGFVFARKSPRAVTADCVKKIAQSLSASALKNRVLLVGVVVDTESEESRSAVQLAQSGVLDFIQLHAAEHAVISGDFNADIPHFCAVNISSADDLKKIDSLKELGEPRILIDARNGSQIGGTGTMICAELAQEAAKKNKLWLAGGISAENVCEITAALHPELLDVSSSLEESPGKKSHEKLEAFFASISQ